uniref:Uncharacterized protein n=1 Tax=Rhizophagus irregularis (strain DAOM 181602 / DAOM 197198 / MUCL 43194) TaxID=747089 RepID=U9T933_RHIID
MKPERKFEILCEALNQIKYFNNCLLLLVHLYYLDRFLEKETEFRARQIMRTTKTNITLLRELNIQEYQGLVLRASEIFNRVKYSGENDVM